MTVLGLVKVAMTPIRFLATRKWTGGLNMPFSWNSLVTILDTQIYQNLNNLHIQLISNHYRQVATLSSME